MDSSPEDILFGKQLAIAHEMRKLLKVRTSVICATAADPKLCNGQLELIDEQLKTLRFMQDNLTADKPPAE